MTTATRRRTLAGTAAGVLIAITGAACSTDDSASGGGSSADAGSSNAGSAAESAADSGASTAGSSGSKARSVAQAPAPTQQQVISTGSVRLAADDVAGTAADVRRIAGRYGGTLAQDATDTDDDGQASHAHLVLRVPVEEFDAALDALEGVGTLVGSDSKTDDVTTQVLDTDVRVEAERRSIRRIQTLFAQAESIDAIVRIENELSARQADLASLEQQQRYLTDQTALSTIDVTVEHPAAARSRDDDDGGFAAGLSAGWHGLTTFAVGLATVAGALLPWLVVVAVFGTPAWAVVRRMRRRRVPAT